MDVASTLEVNHVKSVCCVIISCDCACLCTIFYLLHECCISFNEYMNVIPQFRVTYEVNSDLNVSSILRMRLPVLDSPSNGYSVK